MIQENGYPKIVFFGTPDFAVASLEAMLKHKYNVVAVVTTPDKPAGRGRKMAASAVKEFALKHNLKILQPERLKAPEFIEALQSLRADLQIVVAFRMLPEVVWAMPPLGTINVHGSLLPQYRGAAPINHAIINGEKETGVTTFQLKHEIDTGDILFQKRLPILDKDNFGSLYLKLMKAGAELLIETLEALSAHGLHPIKQEVPKDFHPAPKIFKQDCEIHWDQPVSRIHNLVRGLSPIPAAFTTVGGVKMKIMETAVEHGDLSGFNPGDFQTDNKSFLKVAGLDGWLKILYLKPEGKREMAIKDFLNGHKFGI